MLAKNLTLPRPCRRRRHRARRAGADRADVARRLGAHPAGLLRRRRALRRRAPARGCGAGGLMQAILVVNAGSSSLKFQIFGIDGDRLERRVGARSTASACARGCRPTARTGRRWSTASYASADVPDLPAAIGGAAPLAARPSAASSCLPSATASCMAARTTTGRCVIDAAVLDAARPRYAAARAAAPAEQPRADPARNGDRPGRAAGRLLRHRLPPRPRRRTPTAMPCRARSTTRACAATASTASPTNISPSGCARWRPRSRGGRVIVAHLGSGASMCALRDGRSVESTMGFTALDGLPMGTRPGPARSRRRALPDRAARHERGRGGATCSTSSRASRGSPASRNDMRDLLASDDPGAAFAIDHFVHRCGLQAGHAGGGARRARRLRLHRRRRRERGRRSAPASPSGSPGSAPSSTRPPTPPARRASRRRASRVALLVVPTDEELMIARHTLALVGAPADA